MIKSPRPTCSAQNFNLRLVCYNEFINYQKETTDSLIDTLLEKGGRIDKFYLQNKKRNPSLVYLNGWFRGRNIREAVTRALADE